MIYDMMLLVRFGKSFGGDSNKRSCRFLLLHFTYSRLQLCTSAEHAYLDIFSDVDSVIIQNILATIEFVTFFVNLFFPVLNHMVIIINAECLSKFFQKVHIFLFIRGWGTDFCDSSDPVNSG